MIPCAFEAQLNPILAFRSAILWRPNAAFTHQLLLIDEHKVLCNPNAQLIGSTVQAEANEAFGRFFRHLVHLNESDKPRQNLVDFKHAQLASKNI